LAIYAGAPKKTKEASEHRSPAEILAEIQEQIDSIMAGMENAIANHEFEKARFYSDEERKLRTNLRQLREQFELEEPAARVPLLCVEIILDDRFSDVQRRSDEYIAEGVSQVWILDPNSKRAYTVTKADGLREFKGELLEIADPPLELELKKIFD
jgi:Uma2 family endonuclease